MVQSLVKVRPGMVPANAGTDSGRDGKVVLEDEVKILSGSERALTFFDS